MHCDFLALVRYFVTYYYVHKYDSLLYYNIFSNITYSNSISSCIFHFFKGKLSTMLNSVENAILLVIVLINVNNILSGL